MEWTKWLEFTQLWLQVQQRACEHDNRGQVSRLGLTTELKERLGNPISAGRNCNGPNPAFVSQSIGVSYSVPDFIFGQAPYGPPGGRAGTRRTELIAEVKRDAGTMYRQYITPAQKKKQLNAIIAYSRKHTDTHVAMFIIARNDLKGSVLNRGRFYIMKRLWEQRRSRRA